MFPVREHQSTEWQLKSWSLKNLGDLGVTVCVQLIGQFTRNNDTCSAKKWVFIPPPQSRMSSWDPFNVTLLLYRKPTVYSSLRWPAFQGSRFFLMLPGTLSGFPNWMIPPPSVMMSFFHKYLSSWWSRADLLCSNVAFMHQLPCSSYQRDLSFSSVGWGNISAKMKDDWSRPLLIGYPQIWTLNN